VRAVGGGVLKSSQPRVHLAEGGAHRGPELRRLRGPGAYSEAVSQGPGEGRVRARAGSGPGLWSGSRTGLEVMAGNRVSIRLGNVLRRGVPLVRVSFARGSAAPIPRAKQSTSTRCTAQSILLDTGCATKCETSCHLADGSPTAPIPGRHFRGARVGSRGASEASAHDFNPGASARSQWWCWTTLHTCVALSS
jgi:hypothetical protein